MRRSFRGFFFGAPIAGGVVLDARDEGDQKVPRFEITVLDFCRAEGEVWTETDCCCKNVVGEVHVAL